MDCSFQGLVELHKSQMDFALRSVIDAILKNSELELTLIRISNVTDDSLFVSIEALVTKTGPASATLSPMSISLCGPSGSFGHLTLPQIKTCPSGAPLLVTNQHVRITSIPALLSFISPIVRAPQATLSLRGGHTSVRALGARPQPLVYAKDVALRGMGGPSVAVQSCVFSPLANSSRSDNSNSVVLVLRVCNPSPMEISFGTCSFDVLDGGGDDAELVYLELKGRLDLRRGAFKASVQGTLVCRPALVAAGEACRDGAREEDTVARLVGKRCAGAAWCDETVKGIDVPLKGMGKVFRALGVEYGEPEMPQASELEEKSKGDEIEEMAAATDGGSSGGSGGGGGWKSKLWKW
ncbi:hypothetical protein F4810DRAFT_528800 [Camillea tinctor]|nr:hypothetical protein F4810DRAFT_528800 [Camillea tinctor]